MDKSLVEVFPRKGDHHLFCRSYWGLLYIVPPESLQNHVEVEPIILRHRSRDRLKAIIP